MTKIKIALLVSVFLVGAAVLPARAQDDNGYDRIVHHLKTKYQAKKVNIPFLWLARFAVGVVRPAGVKSFSVTLFKDLKFSVDQVDTDMRAAMRESFGPEWIPALRVRSRTGEQAYLYVREDGEKMRMALVTVNKDEASIVRATFSPKRLADFINDPSILGIHIGDEKQKAPDSEHKPDDAAKAQPREVSR